MAAGAAVASSHADGAFDDAFGGDLRAGATRGAAVGGAEGFGLFGERSIRLKFWHAGLYAAHVPPQVPLRES
jgi:hypothetical protein